MVDLNNEKLSLLIGEQLPDFVRSDHPRFQEFLETYYEYMESTDNPYYSLANLLEYRDSDKTTDAILKRYFRHDHLHNFSLNRLHADTDISRLVKNIKDVYKHKGDENAIRALWRALFNEEIEFYYPKKDMLLLNQTDFKQINSLRIGSTAGDDNLKLVTGTSGTRITGTTSNATAVVESVEKITETIITLTGSISASSGDFEVGEAVTQTDSSDSKVATANVISWTASNIFIQLEDDTKLIQEDSTDFIVFEEDNAVLKVNGKTGARDFEATAGTIGNMIGSTSGTSYPVNSVSSNDTIFYDLGVHNVVGTFSDAEQITGTTSDGTAISEDLKLMVTDVTIIEKGDDYKIGDTIQLLGSGGGSLGTLEVKEIEQNASELFTGDGSTTTFTLDIDSDTNDATVVVAGTEQTAITNYKILGKTLTFVSAPANNAVIEVRHLTGPISSFKITNFGIDFPSVSGTLPDTNFCRTTLELTDGDIVLEDETTESKDILTSYLLGDNTGDRISQDTSDGNGLTADEVVEQRISPPSPAFGEGRIAKAEVVEFTTKTKTLIVDNVKQNFKTRDANKSNWIWLPDNIKMENGSSLTGEAPATDFGEIILEAGNQGENGYGVILDEQSGFYSVNNITSDFGQNKIVIDNEDISVDTDHILSQERLQWYVVDDIENLITIDGIVIEENGSDILMEDGNYDRFGDRLVAEDITDYKINSITEKITLQNNSSTEHDFYNEMALYLNGGTGSGQSRRITDYDGTQYHASVETPFDIHPDSTTTYQILPYLHPSGSIALSGTDGSRTDAGDEILLEDATDAVGDKLLREKIAEIVPTLGSLGKKVGTYSSDKGQINELNYIQDSKYYQDYSYEVKSGVDTATFKKIARSLVHPAGMAMFGKVLLAPGFGVQKNVKVNSSILQDLVPQLQFPLAAATGAILLETGDELLAEDGTGATYILIEDADTKGEGTLLKVKVESDYTKELILATVTDVTFLNAVGSTGYWLDRIKFQSHFQEPVYNFMGTVISDVGASNETEDIVLETGGRIMGEQNTGFGSSNIFIVNESDVQLDNNLTNKMQTNSPEFILGEDDNDNNPNIALENEMGNLTIDSESLTTQTHKGTEFTHAAVGNVRRVMGIGTYAYKYFQGSTDFDDKVEIWKSDENYYNIELEADTGGVGGGQLINEQSLKGRELALEVGVQS